MYSKEPVTGFSASPARTTCVKVALSLNFFTSIPNTASIPSITLAPVSAAFPSAITSAVLSTWMEVGHGPMSP